MGFIAMKALSGGLITDAEISFCYLWQYPHVVPIWGIQREEELDQFIELEKNPPVLNKDRQKQIDIDKKSSLEAFAERADIVFPVRLIFPFLLLPG